MTILYVDDDPDDRQFFQEAVSAIDSRFDCVMCQDGLDALSFLSEGKFPDIIFLDINMPLMDGKACLMEIRSNRDTAHIPVIMFSTTTNPEERIACEDLGATDFLLKPVSCGNMKDLLASILAENGILQ